MAAAPIFDAESQSRRGSLLLKENSASPRPCVKRLIYFIALLALSCEASHPTKSASTLTYPPAPKGDTVDDYHGTKVADPYRWMEALDSKEVADWVAASNAVTEPYLRALPLRGHFSKRLTELWNYPRAGVPVVENGRLFYARNTGLQRQAPVFMRVGITGEPSLVIDPNIISADGSVSLSQWEPSPDAKLLAYALSEGGADWATVHVRDIASGTDLADDVRWMRFSGISWTKDSKGFFYSRYPEPPKNKVLEAELTGQAIYYHRVGKPQAQDVLVYQRQDLSTWIVNGSVTHDGRYLLVLMAEGADNRNRLYAADLGRPEAPRIDAPIKPLIETDDAEYAPIGNDGATIYVRSDKDAPNRKVLAIDIGNPSPSAWKTIVAERKEAIENAAVIGGRIVAQYLVDVQSVLSVFDLGGHPQGNITLPGPGTVGEIHGREDSPDVWYSFSSPLVPSTVYRFDPAVRRSAPFEAATPPIDAGLFETKALFAVSKDGTRVPFFLTAKKSLPLDGNNPTVVYGYGGFSVSVLPTYRSDVPAWLERGGVWVTVNLRGGAEYGEAWHKAGWLEKKQNVFDDLIAVAEYLVKERYTSPAHLGVMGGSNGGLLVGAVIEQRPDLFAVALPAVGVMDMLRYDHFTGGRLWRPEYGSASNPSQFPFLIKYSPLHNIKTGTCYPATLITTADHDDRVVPSHSFKFAAALQAAQGCDKPVLIRVEVQGSHGYRPTDKLIAERADQWAFAAEHTGL
jgi:prolyl oligopeptidase